MKFNNYLTKKKEMESGLMSVHTAHFARLRDVNNFFYLCERMETRHENSAKANQNKQQNTKHIVA